MKMSMQALAESIGYEEKAPTWGALTDVMKRIAAPIVGG